MLMQAVSGVIAIIGLVIVLTIGTQILGSAAVGCTGISGYNSTHPGSSTGWGETCVKTGTEGQAAYKLLLILPMLVAASMLMLGIRFFGGY